MNPPISVARTFFIAGIIIFVTILAYTPAIRGGFVWDDDRYVTNNQTLQTVEGLKRIWCDFTSTVQYYPLVFTSYWVEYRLWHLNPAGYHAVNVILHGISAVLLWRVLRRLGVPGAQLAAAIFALHPVQVESVAWITERKNVLSGALYLSSLLCWLYYCRLNHTEPRSSPSSPRRPAFFWTASLVLFTLAMLSKTATCSLPVAMLILIWWKRGRLSRRDITGLIPFFVVGIALSLVTVWVERVHVGAEGKAWALSYAGRCLVAGRAFWFYLGKLVYPSNLTFIYERWIVDPARWWQYIPPAAVIAGLAGLWLLGGRIGRGPLAAMLFFLVTLAPALGFFNVYYMQYSFVADHFQYLASIGPITLLAALLTAALQGWPRSGAAREAGLRTAVGYMAQGALLGILAVLTWCQATIYTNVETLWHDTLRKNPSAWLAHNNLGALMLKDGDLGGAVYHLSESLRFNPDYVLAHNNLGSALVTMGDAAGAAHHFHEAMGIQPDFAPAYKNMGNLLMSHGKPEEAVGFYRKALELNPGWPEVANNLAWILCTHPNPQIRGGQEAVRLAQAACAATGHQDPAYLDTLAATYAEIGDFTQAVDTARRALERAEALRDEQSISASKAGLLLYQEYKPCRIGPQSNPS